ncbi:alpha-amylase/subtilisin inhibitor-like [Phragmites australis]|uniref:alpha-amylase/subtilisin inhibitor-like n=1 Tax=Phragmites australis TaxID=29695 RepID=UPI002D78CD1F|nr:alpha-amylase/subtilisin inhibitor-like [Phragmites australis]
MDSHLLLLSLLAIFLSCNGAAPPPVYDTDGLELSADASYYVLPAVRGHGGGLTMAPHVLRCPLFVAQETNELRKGFPVRFTPEQQQGGDRTVRVSTDVRIHFAAVTTCVQTTEWHVSGDDEPTSGRQQVVTGPILAPSPGGREKVFRVESYGRAKAHTYKLVSCRGSCQDLGVFRDDRGSWLGASDRAHVVVFKKAPPV